jgi:hypothetical protein
MRTSHIFLVVANLAVVAFVQAQTLGANFTRFRADSYSIEYPASWTYQRQPAPDGTQLHMFVGPQEQNAIPYCHITQQPLDATLVPEASKLSDKQKVDLFSTGGQDLLFSLYNNLASAQGLRLIHTNAVVFSQSFPAFMSDFIFRVPQGFVYRVRAHYTYWQKAQLSLWCQTVSRSETAAVDVFLRNLATFQRVAASVRISP